MEFPERDGVVGREHATRAGITGIRAARHTDPGTDGPRFLTVSKVHTYIRGGSRICGKGGGRSGGPV